METVDVIFEENRTKELYNRYFKFERRREFKKVPSGILYGICTLLILIGVLVSMDILWILGVISASLLSIFLLYFFIRFQIAFNKFSSELEKKAKTLDKDFQFAFDSESISYKSENMNSELKWTMIKNYDLNGEDLYLYLENRELLDIISEKIIGSDRFRRFKEILVEKVKQMPNKK